MAKTRAYGADAQLLAVFEDSYGAVPDGSAGGVYSKMSFGSFALGAERPLGTDPLLGAGRDAQDPFYDAVTSEGDIGVPIDLRAIGFWLKGVYGAPVSTDNADGTYDHVFMSGLNVPSLSLEMGHANLDTPRYFTHSGVKLDNFGFDMTRTGAANATISAVAQSEVENGVSQDSAPVTHVLRRFLQSSGEIKVDGNTLGNVTAGNFNYSNNLDRVEAIRADGLIDGLDETEATAEGTITVRFSSDLSLVNAINAETPVSLDYSFVLPGAEGYRLTFAMPRVFLPRKKHEIDGPAGISAEYDWRAAKDAGVGHMLQVTLRNDVAAY